MTVTTATVTAAVLSDAVKVFLVKGLELGEAKAGIILRSSAGATVLG